MAFLFNKKVGYEMRFLDIVKVNSLFFYLMNKDKKGPHEFSEFKFVVFAWLC